MKFYLAKTPKFIQQVFKNYRWRFSLSKKEIYLTFDDGPTTDITEWVLNLLKKYDAKATFFCIGKNIVTNKDIFNRIIKEKHSIGNHTYNHKNGFKTSTKEYIEDFVLTDKIIEKSNFTHSKLFRPPYGKIKKRQAKNVQKLGYKIIMWDVLSGDFDTSISNEKCFKNVLNNTCNGSIIVFHDSVKSSEKLKYVLPKALNYFSQKGFKFKAIP